MRHDGGWTRRSSRYLFESQWFNVRQDGVLLPSGEEISYTLVEHPGFAMAVPLLADGQVVLERLYRYTIQQYSLECPSGGLDGEEPRDAARRELLEETGYVADSFDFLGSFHGNTGISDELFHLFLATGLRDSGKTKREPTEQMELVVIPLEEAFRLAMSGEISDSPSALALYLAHHRVSSAV